MTAVWYEYEYEYEWEAANRCSQGLAHPSTRRHAGELNFRVRDGYGCYLAAVAALTPTSGIEPLSRPTSVDEPISRSIALGESDIVSYVRAIQFAPGLDSVSSHSAVHIDSG